MPRESWNCISDMKSHSLLLLASHNRQVKTVESKETCIINDQLRSNFFFFNFEIALGFHFDVPAFSSFSARASLDAAHGLSCPKHVEF